MKFCMRRPKLRFTRRANCGSRHPLDLEPFSSALSSCASSSPSSLCGCQRHTERSQADMRENQRRDAEVAERAGPAECASVDGWCCCCGHSGGWCGRRVCRAGCRAACSGCCCVSSNAALIKPPVAPLLVLRSYMPCRSRASSSNCSKFKSMSRDESKRALKRKNNKRCS